MSAAPDLLQGREIVWAPQKGAQESFLSCPVFEVLLEGPRGGGKGLPLEEPVLTPRGFRPIGRLRVGSVVCCADGSLSRVIGVFPQGHRPTFEIEFDDGAIARCDDQHIWAVHAPASSLKRNIDYRLMLMPELVKRFRAGRLVQIPTCDAPFIQAPTRRAQHEIEPYLLGLLLGDGSFNLAGDIRFCTTDAELANHAVASGFKEYASDVRNGLRSFGVSRGSDIGTGIRCLGLLRKRAWEKAIPATYLNRPAEERLALLQGLMDTDGYADDRGHASFSSCSEELSRGVQWLARSLGAKATLKVKKTPRRDAHLVYIQSGGKFNPFRLRRKAERFSGYMHDRLVRRVVAIRELGEQETVCIKIDHPSGLFLTRDFVVTHNSDAFLMDFAQFVGRGYGAAWRGIIFRRTYDELRDIIAKSQRWFPRIWPSATYNGAEHYWRWPTGEQLFLGQLMRSSDYDKRHGHEYPWLGFEELTRWNTLDLYLAMMSCCRSTFRDLPRHVRSTTNPYGVGHNAVKQRFQLPHMRNRVIRDPESGLDRVAIFSPMTENRKLLEADPHYVARIQESARNPTELQAWLHGSWDIVSGGMFDDVWRTDVHVVDDFEIPPTWRIDRAFDWGSSKPFAVQWWAESDGGDYRGADGRWRSTVRGDLFLVRQWYGSNGRPNEGLKLLASDIAKGIVDRELHWGWRNGDQCRVRAGVADSAIFTTENGMCIATDMAKRVRVDGREFHGIVWNPSDKKPGSRRAGWEILRQSLKNAHPVERGAREKPGLFVFRGCADFLRTFPSLPRDERDPDDVDTDAEDHDADAARYKVMARGIRSGSSNVIGAY